MHRSGTVFHGIVTPISQMTSATRVFCDGAELFVRRSGGGPDADTLLAVPTGPGLSHELLGALDVLASPALELVTFDQRGVGRSSGEVDPLRAIDQGVADIATIRKVLGAKRLHLLGHGWGGLLAALSAARNPETVCSLVLVDSLPPDHSELELARTHERRRLREYQARGLVPAELPLIDDDPGGWLLARLPIYFVDPRHPAARTLWGARLSPESAAAAGLALNAYDVRAELTRVSTPTLHVMTPVPFGYAMGEAMANALPNAPARRVRLTTAGHLPFIEAPAPFLSVLAGFLRPAA